MFHIRNGLKQGVALSPLLFSCALEYVIGEGAHISQDGLKLNGTHQLLVYADDVNILDGFVPTLQTNTGALLVGSMEIGLEVNADKTKCMVVSRDQNARQSHNIKIDNSSFVRVEEFKYLEPTLTNQSSLQEELRAD